MAAHVVLNAISNFFQKCLAPVACGTGLAEEAVAAAQKEKEAVAATTIQARLRGIKVRTEAASKAEAATKIQRIVRGTQGRVEASKVKAEAAATTIQRIVRGNKGRAVAKAASKTKKIMYTVKVLAAVLAVSAVVAAVASSSSVSLPIAVLVAGVVLGTCIASRNCLIFCKSKNTARKELGRNTGTELHT